MFHSTHFLAGRQKLVQVPSPSSGIFASAEIPSLCCIEDQFDSVSQSTGGFGLFCPNRLEDFQHMLNAYFLRGKIAYDLERISSQYF